MIIELTRGKQAVIDDSDWKILSGYKWFVNIDGDYCTACARQKTKEGGKMIKMHTLIMRTPKGFIVDHIDGNTLNNTRSNLRICTVSQNRINSKLPKTNTSGFKGVCWRPRDKKWIAQLNTKEKSIYLGMFKDKKDAAKAYDSAAVEHFGEFAKTNQKICLL